MNIISWVFRNCRFAASQATFDDSQLKASIADSLERIRSYHQDKHDLRQTPLDLNSYFTAIRNNYSILAPQTQTQIEDLFTRLTNSIAAGNHDQSYNIVRAMFEIIRKTPDPQRPNQGYDQAWLDQNRVFRQSMANMRTTCLDLMEHLSAVGSEPEPIDTKVQEYEAELMTEYNKSLAQAEDVKQRLITFANAAGIDVSFVLTPNIGETEYKQKILYPIGFSVEIAFPNRDEAFQDFGPSFTMFDKADKEGKAVLNQQGGFQYDVDDVLEWADTDFFTNDQEKQFYFQLIDFIRTGQLPAEKPVKFITLYRGMSPQEYVKWEQGEAIPKGKYFTSVPTAQFAQDIPGEYPELFSFRVRSDAISETSPQTFQLMLDSKLDGKKIIPIQ